MLHGYKRIPAQRTLIAFDDLGQVIAVGRKTGFHNCIPAKLGKNGDEEK